MRIFLSYASSDRKVAEQIFQALTNEGHFVFYDQKSLAPSGNYNLNLRNEINKSDILLFLITPDSICKKSYALTELCIFQEKYKSAENRVLPVVIKKTKIADVPSYLKSVTLLEPIGNVVAAISLEVNRIHRYLSLIERTKRYVIEKNIIIFIGLFVVIIFYFLIVMLKDDIEISISPYEGYAFVDPPLMKLISENNKKCIKQNKSVYNFFLQPCKTIDILFNKNDYKTIETCLTKDINITSKNEISVIREIINKTSCLNLVDSSKDKVYLSLDESMLSVDGLNLKCKCAGVSNE